MAGDFEAIEGVPLLEMEVEETCTVLLEVLSAFVFEEIPEVKVFFEDTELERCWEDEGDFVEEEDDFLVVVVILLVEALLLVEAVVVVVATLPKAIVLLVEVVLLIDVLLLAEATSESTQPHPW